MLLFGVLSYFITNGFAAVTHLDFNYDKLGYDWPSIPVEKLYPYADEEEIESKVNECGMSNQSPINLKSSGLETISASSDIFSKWYSNLEEKDKG